MNSIQEALEIALKHHLAGESQRAEQIYRQVLQIAPNNADAWHRLGMLFLQVGKADVAADHIRRAISFNERDAAFHNNLALCYQTLGNPTAALECYQHAIRVNPQWAEARLNQGILLAQLGRQAEAAASYREAVRLDPKRAEAHNNLAITLTRLGQLDEASAAYRQALQLKPDFAEAHNNLGHVRLAQGKYDEAAGRYRKAVQIKPDYFDAHSHLGIALLKLGQTNEALISFRRAIELKPDHVDGYINLGNALMTLGRVPEAAATAQQALRFDPRRLVAMSNYLLSINYDPEIDSESLFNQHRQGAQLYAAQAVRNTSYGNAPDPTRRLRIGYLSPDYRRSAAASFIEPIPRFHHRSEVEVIMYADLLVPDTTTERLRAAADVWRETTAMTDDQIAALVREDQIDILVDLAGYTANNRMGVFARKPAPVQASYLGYPTTTGLEAVDYRITDAVVDPEGEDRFYSEKLVRLEHGFCAYQPPHDAPPVAALPGRKAGHITFGSLHNLPKLNTQVVALWCQVLRAVPTARLLLFRDAFGGGADGYFREMFREQGFDGPRVEFRHAAVEGASHLAIYNEIDVSLDTLPWSGHTTACESLWMGVPIMTLSSGRAAGRMVASVLTRVGLTNWIAASPEEYVAMAQRVAGDLDELERLRSVLRQQVSDSPLCDGPAFTRDLEDAYRQMWRTWCDRQAGPSST